MMGRAAALAGLLTALTGTLCSPASAADTIYWTNFSGNNISFANLDGTGSGGAVNTTGATALNQPAGVTIDPAAGRIYWASAGVGKISFANLDGSGGGGDLDTTGATVGNLRGLAIDPAGGRVYWANTAGGTIGYANLNGSGGGNLSTTGATVSNPNGVAIDPASNRIYWANRNTTTGNKISYANLDGTGMGADLATAPATVSGPAGLAVNPAGGRIYWANQVIGADSQKIAYANLDGSGGANLNTAGSCMVCAPVTGVALDPDPNRIYWTNSFTTAISFANLDSSGSGGDLSTAGGTVSEPAYVAILKTPLPTGAPTISGGTQTGSVLTCSQGTWAPNRLGAYLYRAPQTFAFQWTLNGTDIGGATTNTHTASVPGTYGCRVSATNAAGTGGPQTSAAHPVSDPPPPVTPGNPTSPINPAGNVRKRKCKKKQKGAAAARRKCRKRK